MNNYPIATILGGGGFIGRYLVRNLTKKNFRCIITTRNAFQKGYLKTQAPPGAVEFIDWNPNDFSNIKEAIGNSDVVINLIGILYENRKQKFSKIHVIGHLEGMCHIFIDKSAHLKMAKKIILNAKMRRTSICGAVETILIDDQIIKTNVKKIIEHLTNNGCEVRVDKKINKLFNNKLREASEKDWSTEYLDAIVSIKTVKGVHEAIDHVLKYGTMHTDSIITSNLKNAKIFLDKVNSSIAMHNVSTQFADGGEFGFGGEIGISTNKLPPRGPVGINQLTSYKYLVSGNGIIRK